MGAQDGRDRAARRHGAGAPFLGLAFIVVFPFVGIAALAWMGARSLIVRDTN